MSKSRLSRVNTLAALFIGLAANGSAHAALVQISFSGSTDGAGGLLDYPLGESFDGRVVYDIPSTDLSASPTFGSFIIAPTLIELNTPLGNISFSPNPLRDDANVMTFTQQENLAAQQTSRLSFGSNELDYDGFDGLIAGFVPISFDMTLQTVANPGGDVLFSDPNQLLSGADSSITAALINSVIQVVYTNAAQDNTGFTGLAISDARINAVPIPGAGLLFLSGFFGLAALRRRG